ncbi:MAG: glycosyltransferase family 4 protein [Bacteroidales bacterium]|nr:glycosyltransferase family 4 protein [Bacteroidales bacterium]
MRVIHHFIQRVPPALGGSESYFDRLGRFLALHGDSVHVWSSTAVDLSEMWQSRYSGNDEDEKGKRKKEKGKREEEKWESGSSFTVHRYRPLTFPGRRYLLKAASLIPVRRWQCLTRPSNPICPAMWRDAGRYDGPIDAVHASAFPYTFPIICGYRLARRRGVPFLLTPFLHLGDPNEPCDRVRRQYTAPPLRWLLHQADRIFVQTPSEFRAVVALGVPEQRVILQGLGVDASECTHGNRERARQEWGIRPDEPVIGHLANLSEEKGSCDLLRAWGGRGRIVLAGPAMPNFTRFGHRFPDWDQVTRLGTLTESQKRDFFAGIDVFVLPSRTDSFGLVLLEAWANAKPVIAYRAGGPADLIRDGIDGLLAPCGDHGSLRAACERLVRDAQLRKRLGVAGRERTHVEFQWDQKLTIVREQIPDCDGRYPASRHA